MHFLMKVFPRKRGRIGGRGEVDGGMGKRGGEMGVVKLGKLGRRLSQCKCGVLKFIVFSLIAIS